jgi:hypothetical protein
MDVLPTDAEGGDCFRPVMRCPTEPMRPSFVMSMWMSSPGRISRIDVYRRPPVPAAGGSGPAEAQPDKKQVPGPGGPHKDGGRVDHDIAASGRAAIPVESKSQNVIVR